MQPVMQQAPSFSAFLHPRYWPTWIGIVALMLIAWMPLAIRTRTGQLLGYLTWVFGKERRYITTVNIGIAFPDLDAPAQQELVKQSFLENGIGLVETVTCWVRKPRSLGYAVNITGLDVLEHARTLHRGVLVVGAHYSTLDLGANLLSQFHPIAATYRPHNNPLFDAFMLRGRLSHCSGVFDRNDIRGAFRHLKAGHTLWYAPDQDYGPDHAVYAPLFGKPAATIDAVSRFATFNDSPVIFARQHRQPGSNVYEFEFTPFPEDFPTGNDTLDATTINRLLEHAIRQHPAQYLWMHKRWKTQPGGKPESPYIDISTPNHQLSKAQYHQVLQGAGPAPGKHGYANYRLANGLLLREFPGVASKHGPGRHPAHRFDRYARALRVRHIRSITVDNIFRMPALNTSAVTFFCPAGVTLDQAGKPLPLAALAGFMAQLHAAGCACPAPVPRDFLLDGDNFAVAEPADFPCGDTPVTLAQRQASLTALADNLALDSAGRHTLLAAYTKATGLPVEEN